MKQIFTKIERLRSLEDGEETLKLLYYFKNNQRVILSSANINFKLVTTLLTSIVPHAYLTTDADNEANRLIEGLFDNLIGVSNLLNQVSLQLMLSNEQINHHLINVCIMIMLRNLFQTQRDDVFYNLLTNHDYDANLLRQKRNLSDINSIFLNGKLYNTMLEYSSRFQLKLDGIGMADNVLNLELYKDWANQQFYRLILKLWQKQLDFTPCMLNLLRLTPQNLDRVLYDVLMNLDQDLQTAFVGIYKKSTRISMMRFFTKNLVKFILTLCHQGLLGQNSYIQLVSLVTSLFRLFQLPSLDIENAVTDILKSCTEKSTCVLLLHSAVLSLKSELPETDFCAGFNTFIKTYWNNEYFIKNQPIQFQEYFCIFLIIYICYIDNTSFLSTLFSNENLLTATTRHLEQPIVKVRFLGIILAEKISSNCSQKLEFNMAQSKNYEKELLYVDSLHVSIDELCTKTELSSLSHDLSSLKLGKTDNLKVIKPVENMLDKQAVNTTTLTNKLINSNRFNPEDSNSEDSDDENYHDPTLTIQNNSIPSTPVYLKDLYSYLTADSKDDRSLKRTIGLTTFHKVVRAKKDFHEELDFWCDKLCDAVLNLKIDGLIALGVKTSINHQGIEKRVNDQSLNEDEQAYEFNHLKLLALITLNVVNPSKMPKYLVEQLFKGDFSIQDRMLVINSIGLAARELKGYQDEINWRNVSMEASLRNSPLQFGKMLPDKAHQSFLKLQTNAPLRVETHRLDGITHDIAGSIHKQSKKLIEDQIIYTGQGKLVKISSKLLKQRKQSQNGNASTKDQYSLIAYSSFFSPFVTIWYGLNNNLQSLGNYTLILITCYLKALNVLVFCSYPSSPNIVEIVTETFQILDQLKTINSELVAKLHLPNQDSQLSTNEISTLLESQLYILLTILQLTSKQVMVSLFQNQIISFFGWLNYLFDNFEDIFGDSPDFQNIKSLIANCLLQINDILKEQLGSLNMG